MKVHVVITSFNEPETIGKAVEQILCPNKDLWPGLQLVVVAPDQPTLTIAEEVCQKYGFTNYTLIKDPGQGKPAALNIAIETITRSSTITLNDDLLILTDGDVYLEDAAIHTLLNTIRNSRTTMGGVGGHPVSLDSRNSMFGYFSQLFCEAANQRRLADSATPMSGYLYAVKGELVSKLFPLPEHVRAEDAYLSHQIHLLGYTVGYTPDALVYVKFPKTSRDWYKQKTRSLGGNVQVSTSARSISQDLRMALFPLRFAKSIQEITWSLVLCPMRLLLWLKIYYNHALKRYKSGAWERIESSK